MVPESKDESEFDVPETYREYTPSESKEIPRMKELAKNPGSLSDFHKDCMACIENCFKGIQFIINKSIPQARLELNNRMKIVGMRTDDRLIAKYVSIRRTRFGEHNVIAEAMTDFKEDWPAIGITQTLDDFWYLSTLYYPRKNWSITEVELEYYARNATFSAIYSSAQPHLHSYYSAAYLQGITQQLALGLQLKRRNSPLSPPAIQKTTELTYFARYRGATYTACLDFCRNKGYHFSYFHNISENSACAVSIWGSADLKHLEGKVGVKKTIPKYKVTTYGHMASSGTISGVVEKQFTGHFPIKTTLSASYNIFSGESGFGIGFVA